MQVYLKPNKTLCPGWWIQAIVEKETQVQWDDDDDDDGDDDDDDGDDDDDDDDDDDYDDDDAKKTRCLETVHSPKYGGIMAIYYGAE